MSTKRPPRLAVRWLELWLPSDERAELLGDLEEEFGTRGTADGVRAARLWYWRQVAVLLWNRRALSGVLTVDSGQEPVGVFTDAGHDWRLAWRSLRGAPAFSSVALISLVVSLGLATAVFSIVNTVLLEPLPFTTADRIVRLGAVSPSGFDGAARLATVGGAPPAPRLTDVMIGAWFERRQAIESIATYQAFPQTVLLDEDALRVNVADVGPEFFDVFPVRAIAGRTLQRGDGELTAPAVAVLSQRLLTQRYAYPADVVGRIVRINDRSFEVAGVLPLDFEWPDRTADIWVVDRTRWPPPGAPRNAGRNVLALGLLSPGATVDDARREGQQISDDLSQLVTLGPRGSKPPTVVVRPLRDEIIEPLWPALVLLGLGTLAVVVAANVNLAGFLLSRNTARHRDIAVRQALGASRWRLIRPLLCEQLWLGVIGAVGALALAWWIIELLPHIAPPNLPRLSSVTLDGTTLFFGWMSALFTALVVGLLPAWRLSSSNLRVVVADGGAAMAGTSRKSERTRGVLVVSQVTVATFLLVGSALVGRSLLTMLEIDPGYRPEGVLSFQVGTPQRILREQPGRLTQFYDALQNRLMAEPGVVSVGTSSALPMHGDTMRVSVSIPGLTPPRDPDTPARTAHVEQVSASYLQTMGAALTRGRFFTRQDSAEAELVAIVNEAYVRTFMPHADPIGQHVPYGVRTFRVIGVVAPIKRAAATMADDEAMYIHTPQLGELGLSGTRGMGTVVRTTGDPMALVPALRSIVRELYPEAPLHNVMPMDERLGLTFAQPRFFALALMMFAGLALATALLGVYGILASTVERRRVEIGVRRALGASTRNMVSLVVGQALRLAGIGVAIGLVLAAAGASFGRSTLYGIGALDGVSYAAAILAIVVVVLVGAWIPMRAALRIDPARVLRTE